MTCPCNNTKREMPKCDAGTPPVLEIKSQECPILFHTINIPASMGNVETMPPTPGAYRNTRVYYEADEMAYLYDSDGIPQLLSGGRIIAAVTSVNGKIGEVELDAEDVGAAPVASGNVLSENAPDSATEGVLGQLYTDTTNMHTYQLTAIDTTDPENPVFTWTQRW